MNNKVWTYVIGKKLSENELRELLQEGKKFVSEWTAHEQQLSATFDVMQGHIIVVKVNEDVHSASGCSIDKLSRFVKNTGEKYGINLLDRFLVAYKNENEIRVTHASTVKELLNKKQLTENTVVLNTAISSQNELEQWEQPLKNTWLKKYLTS